MNDDLAIPQGASERRARPLPNGAIRQFFAGVAYPFEGLRFIREHKLWGPVLWIVLIDIAVFAAILAVTLLLIKPVIAALGAFLASSFAVQSSFAASLITVVTYVAWFVIIVAVVGLSGVAVVLLGQALASPFLDALSEKVESSS